MLELEIFNLSEGTLDAAFTVTDLGVRSLRSFPVAREIVGLHCDSRFLIWVVVAGSCAIRAVTSRGSLFERCPPCPPGVKKKRHISSPDPSACSNVYGLPTRKVGEK